MTRAAPLLSRSLLACFLATTPGVNPAHSTSTMPERPADCGFRYGPSEDAPGAGPEQRPHVPAYPHLEVHTDSLFLRGLYPELHVQYALHGRSEIRADTAYFRLWTTRTDTIAIDLRAFKDVNYEFCVRVKPGMYYIVLSGHPEVPEHPTDPIFVVVP